MKSIRMTSVVFQAAIWLIVAGMCGRTFGQEFKIVVPNEFQDTEGNTSVDFNFSGGFRVQVAYSSDEFNDLPASHHFITEIAFRPDAAITEPQTVVWEDTEWFMSTTERAVDDRSLVFAENHGPDQMLVYDGLLSMTTQAAGPPEGPRDFDYRFLLEHPFYYDPSEGNLVIDIIAPSGYTPNFGDDQFTRVNQQLLDVPFTGAESGFWFGNGLIMQLTFVPEPSSLALIALGFLGVLRYDWRIKTPTFF